jgi:transposase-like protein
MEQPDPLDALFARAKQHRISMATICRLAEVDPTTPSRWRRKKNGATLEKVTALNVALSEIINQQVAA